MARQKNNIVMNSTRGMFGKQVVFKKRAGKNYVSAPPQRREGATATEGQQEVQSKFKRSSIYAAAAIKDPAVKQAYLDVAKKGQSAYNMALKDAFGIPEILSIITDGYTGAVGNTIVVQAKDDFKVKAVKVSIFNSANELIEEGDAVARIDGLNWTYTVTMFNANAATSKVKATAVDLPGNEGTMEVTL